MLIYIEKSNSNGIHFFKSHIITTISTYAVTIVFYIIYQVFLQIKFDSSIQDTSSLCFSTGNMSLNNGPKWSVTAICYRDIMFCNKTRDFNLGASDLHI